MRTTKQLSITLPNNMAEALKERVASGAYASESEVVRDGLRALFAREEAIETWLRTEVTAAYDELRADPSRAIRRAASSTPREPGSNSPISNSGLPQRRDLLIGRRGSFLRSSIIATAWRIFQ